MAKTILGKIYVGDNQTVFFAACEDGSSEIFLMDGRCQYRLLLDDRGSAKKLNFDVHHQITGIYRLRKGCEKTIYFTDNYNPPRYLNLNNIEDFKEILDTEPMIQYGTTDVDKLLLQKTYDMTPQMSVEIVQNGQLLAGSYNVAVRYVDEDLNPSEWIYATEPVMIWHDNSNDYNSVRATSNNDVEYRKYGPTTKAIRVSVRNRQCDHSYTFVQFALIGANSGTGFVNDVVYSPLQELDFGRLQSNLLNDTSIVYTFTGGTDVTTGSEDEILANTEIFDRVKCLEQADNRLVMGNVTDMDVDWCKLQKYASRITSDCVWKKITVDSMSEGGQKDPLVLYNNNVGYQPGEIYSFGIVYVFENGAKSPVYHIPGKSPSADDDDIYSSGNVLPMSKRNQCETAKYSDVSTACEGFKFWGYDNMGQPVNGSLIRHHRFPYQKNSTGFMTQYDVNKRTYMVHYNMIVGITKGRSILGRFKQNFDTIYIKYELEGYKERSDFNRIVYDDLGEYDLNVKHDELTSMYKHLEVSYREDDLIVRRPGFSYANLGFEEADKRNHINDADAHNGCCSNGSGMFPYQAFFRSNKQRRCINIYEYNAADYDSVMFTHLQEYPQYRPGDITTNTRPLYISTGGVMGYYNFGWKTAQQKTLINDKFEEIGDNFFYDKMSLWYKRKIRVILDNLSSNENFGNDDNYLHFKERGSGNNKVRPLMRTNTGFYIEPRVEISESHKGNTEKIIYGIRFSNVEIPDDSYLNGHKIVGYMIVQNERTDENATVIDSAVLTPLFVENNRGVNNANSDTIVSSRLFPNSSQHSTSLDMTAHDVTSFCHNQAGLPTDQQDAFDFMVYKNPNRDFSPSVKDSHLVSQKMYPHAVGMINPEFKFNRKEYYNFSFRELGYFKFRYARYSTDYNEAWVTQDVQAGSSYNKKINSAKDKDNDGFDLHVFHKNSFVQYIPHIAEAEPFRFENDQIHYLAPTTYIDKDCRLWDNGLKNMQVVNMSGDNSMAFLFFDYNVDIRDRFTSDDNERIDRLPYGYLEKKVPNPYANFNTLPYYPVSDVFYFENENGKPNTAPDVFRGDCFVSPMKYTTGSLYDIRMKKRARKQTWWQYVVGGTLVVGGAVGSIWTVGATASLIGPGISMIQNGIRTDVAIKNQRLFQQKNCKRALSDTWVNYFINRDQEDDEIQWLFESVDCLWFESRLNINWRVGTSLNDVSDYLDPLKGYNGSDLRYYFTKKLTYPDKDHSDGRMYYGFAQAEIYDINKDFQRRNRQKAYYCIPVTYECCSECQNSFPKRLVYSQMSFAEEKTDNFKVFLPGNYKDIPGETGDVTNVTYQGQDAFMVFTEEGLWKLAPQRQQQVNQITKVVSFIGTGDFFSGEPQRFMKNDANITFGSRHQNSFIDTPNGLFWYSEHDNAIYTFADKQPVNIFKQAGMGKFFEQNGRIKMDMDYYDAYRIDFPYKDNPSYEYGTGYVLGWDNRYERLLITKKDNVVPVTADSCALDSKAMTLAEGVVADTIAELVNDGAVNICYRWNQRKCGFEIEYDAIQSERITNYSFVPNLYVGDDIDYEVVVFIDVNVEYKDDNGNTVNLNIDDFLPQYFNAIPDGHLHLYINYRDGVTPHDFGGYTVDETFTSIDDFLENYDPADDGIHINDKFVFFAITNNVSNSLYSLGDHKSTLIDWDNNYRFKCYYFPIYYRTKPPVIADSYNGYDYYDETEAKMEVFLASKGVYNSGPLILVPGATSTLFPEPIIDEYVYSETNLASSHCELNCTNDGSNLDSYVDSLNDMAERAGTIFDSVSSGGIVTDDTFDNLARLYELLNAYLKYNDVKNSYDYTVAPGNVNQYSNYYCYKDLADVQQLLVQNGIDPCDGNDHASDYQNTIAPAIAGGRHPFLPDIELVFNGTSTTMDSVAGIKAFILSLWQHLFDVISNYSDFVDNGNHIDNSEVGLYAYFSTRVGIEVDYHDDLRENIGESDSATMEAALVTAATPPNTELTSDYVEEVAHIIGNCHIMDVESQMPVVNFDLVTILSSMFSQGNVSYVLTQIIDSNTHEQCTFEHNTEYVYLDEPAEDFDDIDKRCSEDNSFTISFKPGVGFVSFHSYKPDMYLWTAEDLFSWRNGSNRIYRHNVEGSYQNFYGDIYPFVLEVVDRNQNTVYGPQVMDSISMMVKADRYVDGSFNEERNVFFGKAYFYNSRQCSLVHDIVAKGGLSSSNYFDEYLSNEMDRFKISAERRESLWHINGLKNYRTDYDTPLHLYDIGARNDFMDNLDMNGWIDKALDESLLDADKDWWDVEPFRDNFLCQRYFYNPSEDDSIRMKVMLSTTAKSQSVDNVLK